VAAPLLDAPPGLVVLVSYRLGGTDGVSIEAAKWAGAFSSLGSTVRTVAGEGVADILLPELAAGAAAAPDPGELVAAFAGADLVVADNICSLPLNPAAGDAVARAIARRPALLRHHDLAWQRSRFKDAPPPPDDPAWRHVTVNERSRLELAARGIEATTMYNRFDPRPRPGDRSSTRRALGLADGERVVLQPTRAIARKNVPGGIVLATAVGATYWLLGPPEDGYEKELERVVGGAPCRVLLGAPPGIAVEDAYAAADAVVLPSTWEGFGNPSIESALHRRPLAIAPYPVSFELRRYGFRWFGMDEPEALRRFLDVPDEDLLDRNESIARMRFSTEELPAALSQLLTGR
jgi:glycosyltransferase involved in cell wall biosynthesis